MMVQLSCLKFSSTNTNQETLTCLGIQIMLGSSLANR